MITASVNDCKHPQTMLYTIVSQNMSWFMVEIIRLDPDQLPSVAHDHGLISYDAKWQLFIEIVYSCHKPRPMTK